MHPLRELWSYARQWRPKILLAILYSTLNKLFDIAPEILIGLAVDTVVKREQSFIAGFGFETPQSQITALGVLTLLIWVCESLFQYLYELTWRSLAQAIQHELRMDAYQHVQRLDLAWYEDASVGSLLSILGEDVNQLERFLDSGANELIQVAVSSLVIGGIFFYIEPTIAMLSVVPIPVILLGSFYFQRSMGPRYNAVREAAGTLGATLSNNLSGIATIKSFVTESREQKRIEGLSQAYSSANQAAIRVSSAFIPLIRMAILAGFLVALVYGGLLTMNGQLPISAYSILIFLTQRLLWPFTRLAQTVDLFERAMASTRRLMRLLATPYSIRDPQEASAMPNQPGAIQIEKLRFAYADGAPVFDGLELEIPQGSFTALVGGTGSGKSTLVKLLLRFYERQGGQILIGERPIESYRLDELRQRIGLVSQDVFLFHGSVFENIAYGKEDASEAEVIAAAKASEAHDFISQLPRGYHTIVGERGQKLSGGQRQRISIARVLLKNPPILIFDEATSAVDNETEAAIQRSMERLAKGRTTIVIAHRLSTVRNADRILLLERGQIAESGTHEQLLAANGGYARLWRIQAGQRDNG